MVSYIIIIIIIIIIKNECHSNIIVDRLQGCGSSSLMDGGKTIPRWRTAAILKIVMSPYLRKKSSAFDEMLYTAADFELDERHVIKNEKVGLDRLRVRQNVFLVRFKTVQI